MKRAKHDIDEYTRRQPYKLDEDKVQAIGSGHVGLVTAYTDATHPAQVQVEWCDGPHRGQREWLFEHETRRHTPQTTERGQRGAALLLSSASYRKERSPS